MMFPLLVVLRPRAREPFSKSASAIFLSKIGIRERAQRLDAEREQQSGTHPVFRPPYPSEQWPAFRYPVARLVAFFSGRGPGATIPQVQPDRARIDNDEATDDGRPVVDATLVQATLALTPEARLRQNDRMLRTIQELRDGFAVRRADDPAGKAGGGTR
jgi:hypothetical protein